MMTRKSGSLVLLIRSNCVNGVRSPLPINATQDTYFIRCLVQCEMLLLSEPLPLFPREIISTLQQEQTMLTIQLLQVLQKLDKSELNIATEW